MPKVSEVRKRLEGYFLAHPRDSHNLESIMRFFRADPAFKEGNVRNYLKQFTERQGIQGPLLLKDSFRRGYYLLNPSFKTLEQVRDEVKTHGNANQRVFQGQEFDPKVLAITAGDHPALPLKRQFFKSILERMGKSQFFAAADIELLKSEAPHLLEPTDKK
jgi:hypothetical protein